MSTLPPPPSQPNSVTIQGFTKKFRESIESVLNGRKLIKNSNEYETLWTNQYLTLLFDYLFTYRQKIIIRLQHYSAAQITYKIWFISPLSDWLFKILYFIHFFPKYWKTNKQTNKNNIARQKGARTQTVSCLIKEPQQQHRHTHSHTTYTLNHGAFTFNQTALCLPLFNPFYYSRALCWFVTSKISPLSNLLIRFPTDKSIEISVFRLLNYFWFCHNFSLFFIISLLLLLVLYVLPFTSLCHLLRSNDVNCVQFRPYLSSRFLLQEAPQKVSFSTPKLLNAPAKMSEHGCTFWFPNFVVVLGGFPDYRRRYTTGALCNPVFNIWSFPFLWTPREQQFFLQRLVFLLLDSAALRFPIPVTTRLLDKSLIPCTNHLENGTIAFALFFLVCFPFVYDSFVWAWPCGRWLVL